MGRDIYIREGCVGCHSQQVRLLAAEVQRYGSYSLASESVFDHPFLWGSKRTGPDLARLGERYSDEWHRIHLRNPRMVVPESNMPAYPWLEKTSITGQNVQDRMRALRLVGVPYSDEEIAAAPKAIEGKTEEDALVAYLQGLGVGVRKAQQARSRRRRGSRQEGRRRRQAAGRPAGLGRLIMAYISAIVTAISMATFSASSGGPARAAARAPTANRRCCRSRCPMNSGRHNKMERIGHERFRQWLLGYFISVVAVGGVVWCVWLLYTQRRWLSTKPANGQVEDTGHVWDGDLTELNNPVPSWWTWMYLLACVFALGYLFFMPGLGEYKGSLGYSSAEEVARNQAKLAEAVRPIYARFETMTVPQIAADPGAREIGQRLFLNTCAQCHGSDAKGGPSFPTWPMATGCTAALPKPSCRPSPRAASA